MGEGILSEISFATTPSRHNNDWKENKSPRPRFHLLAEVSEFTDPDKYSDMKKAVQKKFSFFDDNALDAARFLFGNKVSPDQIYWHGGNVIVWFGLTWSLELYEQTNARLWRQGQQASTVVVQHIVTAGTIDENILAALEKKDKTQAALIDAVKANLEPGGSSHGFI